jgi:hypothetical protein
MLADLARSTFPGATVWSRLSRTIHRTTIQQFLLVLLTLLLHGSALWIPPNLLSPSFHMSLDLAIECPCLFGVSGARVGIWKKVCVRMTGCA